MNRGVALVTGGSRGIGAAVSRAAAAAGWAVCLTYRDDEAAATDVASEIEANGGVVAVVRADVTLEDDVIAVLGSLTGWAQSARL